MTTTAQWFKVSGKDVRGCSSELKADGFKVLPGVGWMGTAENVERFKARGYKVKVFFTAIECDAATLERLS